MIINHLKIAFRSLLKQRIYSLINLAGLSVGIASALLILNYVRFEFSFDKELQDNDRIYRMVLERKYPNHSTLYSIVPHSFAAVAARNFPEIEEACNIGGFANFSLTYKDDRDEIKQFDESYLLVADSMFFKMFSFQLIKGNRNEVLRTANEIVMTEEMAKRYFGDADPIGKIVTAGNDQYKVSGVIQDIPANSHFRFNCILSMSSFPFYKRENFTSFSTFTYFKLRPNASAATLESKLPQMVNTYASAEIERELGKSWSDYLREGNGYRYFLQPLTSIHLDPINLEGQMKPSGNINTMRILIGVAILILVIACINFMNLSTARSAERAKEVGVRKAMGSYRQQLINQFLTESFLMSALGVFLAAGLIQLAAPLFNEFTGVHLNFSWDSTAVLAFTVLLIVVGLLAGIYPALILSSYDAVVVMKGNFTSQSKGKWIRNGLVVFQFWISIVLMIGTLVIQRQMDFMRTKSLGFDREQVIVLEKAFILTNQQINTFVEEVRQMPQVTMAASSTSMPGREADFFGRQYQPQGSSEILTTKFMAIGDGFLETLGFSLKAGRGFSPQTNDSTSVLLNERAVKVMGIENPIGHKLTFRDQDQGGRTTEFTYTVVGIVGDFNFISLKEEITPLVLHSNESINGFAAYIMAKIELGGVESALSALQEKWKKFAPDQSFKFSFLDQNINAQYQAEEQAGSLFAVFSALAVFIACIGLFGLSAYTTSLRTKEIGIRKVLGASVFQITTMLSLDFTRMIALSFLLAVPLAWYLMENWWLSSFAYRISVSPTLILLSGVLAFLIGWITVSYQSIRAAIQNPVRSLKNE